MDHETNNQTAEQYLSDLTDKEDRLSLERLQATDKLERKAGSLALHEGRVFDVADRLSERQTTDPFGPESGVPRAPENYLGGTVMSKAMGWLAVRFSPDGPNADKLDAVDESREGLHPETFLDRYLNVATAKKIQKQKVRQDQAKHAEAVFGGGLGIGKKAQGRTVVARFNARRELRQKYKDGEISAVELVTGKDKVKSLEVTVPVSAVNRTVRRERLGGAYAEINAADPLVYALRARGVKKTEKKVAKIDSRLSTVSDEKARIQSEIELRDRVAEEDED